MRNEWIALDSHRINKPVSAKVAGVTVAVSAAPFHTPSRARALEDQEGNLIIEFGYDDSSKPTLKQQDDAEGVRIKIDENSGRIYEFFIPASYVSGREVAAIELSITSVSEAMARNISKQTSNGSYDTAVQALKNYANGFAQAAASNRCSHP